MPPGVPKFRRCQWRLTLLYALSYLCSLSSGFMELGFGVQGFRGSGVQGFRGLGFRVLGV